MDRSGIERIAAERQRQIDVEGWTPEHDDNHDDGEMAVAAALYAAGEPMYRKCEYENGTTFSDPWPWSPEWDKRPREIIHQPDDPTGCEDEPGGLLLVEDTPEPDRLRSLEKAGALIAAEIDRLLRLPT